jgi:hypothetical protein
MTACVHQEALGREVVGQRALERSPFMSYMLHVTVCYITAYMHQAVPYIVLHHDSAYAPGGTAA